MASSVERVDLDGKPIKAITICMIGAGGFIGSHLCEKLMSETPHTVLAVDVYNDKIKHLLEPDSLPWSGRIQFHRINIKNDSRLEGLIKMADLTINLAAICTPADYNTRPLDTIYSNFIDALPVVKYCSENNKRIIHFSTCEVYGKTIGSYLPKDSPLRQTSGFQCLYIEGASAVLPLSIAKVTLDDQKLKAVDFRILWSSSANISKYKSYFSSPELIEFPTKVPGQNAYAYFYPPTNPIYQTSQHEKPPLLLKSHGGPTAETHGILNPSIQYWSLLLNPMSI